MAHQTQLPNTTYNTARPMPILRRIIPARGLSFRFGRFIGPPGEANDPPATRRLEQELQRELYQPRLLRCQNLIERRRAEVAIGNVEVSMVEEVEELRSEL